MPDREVVVKISAKNLTAAEFKKARAGLAGIKGDAEGATKKTTGLQRAFSSIGKAAPGALKMVTAAAAASAGAVAGLTIAVIKLGERGAVVADVKDAFDRLSASAGETGSVMLGELQAGVKGTVTGFELMKLANMALGAGILKTSTDARTLAEGARLLAKRTGGDTVQAFQTLTTAIASGRTAQLKQLGLFVDNKKAVEDYAKAQGITVTSMTDAHRATALQVATMAALRNELATNAPPLADFGELIEQGKVAVKNLVDGLAVMISQSPVLIAGMHKIRDIISKAFGGEQENLILGIVNIIETAAFVMIEFGQTAITVSRFLYEGFSSIKLVVLGIAEGFVWLAEKVSGSIASMLELGASIPVLGNIWKVQAGLARGYADDVAGVSSSLKQQMADAAIAAAGNDVYGMGLNTASAALDQINIAMINAGMTTKQLNVDVAQAVVENTTFEGSLENVMAMLDEHSARLRKSAEDAKWFGTETDAMGLLVRLQAMKMTQAFESFGMQTRSQMEATVEKMEKDFETISKSGQATAMQIEEAWEKLEEARRQATGETTDYTISENLEVVAGAMGSFAQLGDKFKIFAVAQAVISTFLAMQKSLAAYPWPFSLVAVAGAAAAGFATVAKIRSSASHAKGTPGLDFADFGRETPTILHGTEAVIPQGGGHRLAEEIAGALGRRREVDPEMREVLGGIRSGLADLKGLPRAIQRSVRDGILLAT